MELSVPTQMSTTISVTPSTSQEYKSQDGSLQMGSKRGSGSLDGSGAKRIRLSVEEFDRGRVEKIDLTVVDDLLCLIYSHKKDRETQVPAWLVSQKIRYTDKRGLDHPQAEVIQSTLESFSREGRAERTYSYYQKTCGDIEYGAYLIRNPDGYSTSLGPMKSELRENLCHKYVNDYDIVNAHPSILLSYLEKKRFMPAQYTHLKRYVESRDLVIESMVAEGCPRECTKQRVLRLIPKKSEYTFPEPQTSFEKEFEAEVGALRDLILQDEAREGRKWIELSAKKHSGAGFSVFLQTMVSAAVRIAIQEFERQGCVVTCIITDGFHVQKAPVDLDQVNAKVQQEYKYVVFKHKEFCNILPTIDRTKLCIKSARSGFNSVLHEPPVDICTTFEEHKTFGSVEDWYVYKRLLVERMNKCIAKGSQGDRFCKTIYYQKVPSDKKENGEFEYPGYKYQRKDYRSMVQAMEGYNIHVYIPSLIGRNDRPHGFNKHTGRGTFNIFHLWCTSHALTYTDETYNLCAEGSLGSVGKKTFNRFHGYRITREMAEFDYNRSKDKGEKYFEFFRTLCQHEHPYTFVITALAYIMLHPECLPGVMLIIKGTQGIGKSLIVLIFQLMLGDCNVGSTGNSEDVTGNFNDIIKDKKVVAFEEATNGAFEPKAQEVIKDLITKEGCTKINSKYQAIERVKLKTFYMLFSNHEWVARIGSDGSRRYYIVDASSKWAKDEHETAGTLDKRDRYFGGLLQSMFSPSDGEFGAFVHRLYKYPLKTNDYGQVVKLENYGIPCPAKDQQIMLSRGVIPNMVLEWIQGDAICSYRDSDVGLPVDIGLYLSDSEVSVPRKLVYEAYVRCCSVVRDRVISKQSFWFEMKKYTEYKVGGKHYLGNVSYRMVVFPRLDVMKELYKKIWRTQTF